MKSTVRRCPPRWDPRWSRWRADDNQETRQICLTVHREADRHQQFGWVQKTSQVGEWGSYFLDIVHTAVKGWSSMLQRIYRSACLTQYFTAQVRSATHQQKPNYNNIVIINANQLQLRVNFQILQHIWYTGNSLWNMYIIYPWYPWYMIYGHGNNWFALITNVSSRKICIHEEGKIVETYRYWQLTVRSCVPFIRSTRINIMCLSCWRDEGGRNPHLVLRYRCQTCWFDNVAIQQS